MQLGNLAPYNIAAGRVTKCQWVDFQARTLEVINQATRAMNGVALATLANISEDDSYNYLTKAQATVLGEKALREISALQCCLEEVVEYDLETLEKTTGFICQLMPDKNWRILLRYVHFVRGNLQTMLSRLEDSKNWEDIIPEQGS
jgi:hypothetical protein|nr:MAG TPA: hypothetical protein [Caudoviricetes sp.]